MVTRCLFCGVDALGLAGPAGLEQARLRSRFATCQVVSKRRRDSPGRPEVRAPGVRAADLVAQPRKKELKRRAVLKAITCYNPEVVEVRMGLCVPASPLHSPLTRLLDKFMFVGKKNFLHELSEFAFPILFPLLLYQRADNNSQAVGIDTPPSASVSSPCAITNRAKRVQSMRQG